MEDLGDLAAANQVQAPEQGLEFKGGRSKSNCHRRWTSLLIVFMLVMPVAYGSMHETAW